MEKLVILSHIDSVDFRDCIERGGNPLSSMFNNSFDLNSGLVLDAFNHFNQEYREALDKSFNRQIDRIPTLSSRGRTVYLPEERAETILERSSVFVTGFLYERSEGQFVNKLLLKQIVSNINKKIGLGIDQRDEILALHQLSQDQHSAFNIDMLSKLTAEANNQLNLIYLPKSFDKFERPTTEKVNRADLYHDESNYSIETDFIHSKDDNSSELRFILGNEGSTTDYKGKSIEELQKLGMETLLKVDNPTMSSQETKTADIRKSKERIFKILDEFQERVSSNSLKNE